MVLEAPPPPDEELADGQRLHLGPTSSPCGIRRGTPPDPSASCRTGIVLGGDVLFNGSIGRTDLPGGDLGTLMHSLHAVFMALPDSTIVYSGHGPETTIGVERMTNPFLTGAFHHE